MVGHCAMGVILPSRTQLSGGKGCPLTVTVPPLIMLSATGAVSATMAKKARERKDACMMDGGSGRVLRRFWLVGN